MALLLLVGLALAACAGSDDPPDASTITAEQGRSVLERSYQLARQGDVDKLCALGEVPSMCRTHFLKFGEAKPSTAPVVVDTYIQPRRNLSKDSYTPAARVLAIAGKDGQGKPYEERFRVRYQVGGELVAEDPVFWTGIHRGTTGPEGLTEAASGQ